MKEKEVVIDGKKIKVATKLSKDNYEINNLKEYTEDTIDLEEIIKEIKNNDKK